MNSPAGSAYFLGAWAALASGLYIGGADYSRAATSAVLVGLWLVMAYQLRRNKATVKSLTTLLLGVAAVYFLSAVDFILDNQYLYAAFNAGAFIVAAGAAIWVSKRR